MAEELIDEYTHPVLSKTLDEFNTGNVLLFPFDSLWGLSCMVNSKTGVEKILSIKKRPLQPALTIMVSDLEMLRRYVNTIHPRIETMLEYHKRPLTIIYNDPTDLVPDYLRSEDGSVAIRLAMNEFCKEVTNGLGQAIVSSSANVHGEMKPLNYTDVDHSIKKSVDYIVPEFNYQPITQEACKVARFNEKNGELEFIE